VVFPSHAGGDAAQQARHLLDGPSWAQSKSAIASIHEKRKEPMAAGFRRMLKLLNRPCPPFLQISPVEKAQDARSFMLSFQ